MVILKVLYSAGFYSVSIVPWSLLSYIEVVCLYIYFANTKYYMLSRYSTVFVSCLNLQHYHNTHMVLPVCQAGRGTFKPLILFMGRLRARKL